jgi:hypothetical protein
MGIEGCVGAVLDKEDIASTPKLLIPYLEAHDMWTAIECVFGEASGRTLGFTPWGEPLGRRHGAARLPG